MALIKVTLALAVALVLLALGSMEVETALPIAKPRYVCNPRCAGYADEDDLQSFLDDNCCTFVPCPTPTYNQAQFKEYKTLACEHYKAC